MAPLTGSIAINIDIFYFKSPLLLSCNNFTNVSISFGSIILTPDLPVAIHVNLQWHQVQSGWLPASTFSGFRLAIMMPCILGYALFCQILWPLKITTGPVALTVSDPPSISRLGQLLIPASSLLTRKKYGADPAFLPTLPHFGSIESMVSLLVKMISYPAAWAAISEATLVRTLGYYINPDGIICSYGQCFRTTISPDASPTWMTVTVCHHFFPSIQPHATNAYHSS